MPITVRPLSGDAAEMAALQRVFAGAPDYAELVTGSPPGAADAQSTFTILPNGSTYDDKFVLGIYDTVAMVGCVDLIRGYPDVRTAYVGLLLVVESHRGQGVGRAALAAVERLVAQWPGTTRLRLGVLRSNPDAARFWTRAGFVATGATKPYRYGPVVSTIALYEKPLNAGAQVAGGPPVRAARQRSEQ